MSEGIQQIYISSGLPTIFQALWWVGWSDCFLGLVPVGGGCELAQLNTSSCVSRWPL